MDVMAYDTRHVRTRSRKRTLRRRATVSNRLDTLHASCVLSITLYESVASEARSGCAHCSLGAGGTGYELSRGESNSCLGAGGTGYELSRGESNSCLGAESKSCQGAGGTGYELSRG